MSTTAIIPDFNGFQWDGTPNPCESVFDNILKEFEQDPVFPDPSYEIPPYHPSAISPIPNIPLTQSSPRSSFGEPYETEKFPSCLLNLIGDEDRLMRSGQMPQPRVSKKKPDSTCFDMNQKTVLQQSITAGTTEKLEKTAPEVKMRSGFHKPKKVHKKPRLPPHVLEARECHNNVEKKYRTRLKLRFERLLAVLEASKLRDKPVGEDDSEAPGFGYSRGEVLDAARQRILTLEDENRYLASEVKNLKEGSMI
ncbi:hypothetical protein DER46DRAFT_685222 [Fusarium sp. MPI-SDFR-AT-0072]|uniref:BHLH domain-containing protein n=1 Tax=Fusarium oxysporum f. sp. rapae TaxID=485398 RepID=A0A8J5P7A0_FUSOX|nr:hypothetical protein Forpe1208_v008324 [Fusarium oxysporum f. sp. rapae]KAH7165118.1 hypothetical protein DER46DRAFT_685222 [Fusarium sp. MPI-SDFR-AT-0072]